jgi:long-chain-fatty-acid--CoA ligase ACSBG
MFADFLKESSVQKTESVAIMGFNSPELFYAAIGSLIYGCTYIGIYPTNGPDEVDHVLTVSNASILVIQNTKMLDNIKLKKHLKNILIYEESEFPGGVKIGNRTHPISSPNDLITYIMTSGTTGKSKAVKITYENVAFTCSQMVKNYSLSNEKIVSYLPLSHIAASMFDMFCHFYHGGTVYFAQQDALQGSLVKTLADVKPTIFLGVPRVWEKISEKMQEVAAEKYSGWFGRILKAVMEYFKDITLQYHDGNASYWNSLMYKISRFLFFRKIKRALGLSDCKYYFSGAAPISRDTLDYFSKIDIIIYEIFGMSETCGVISANKPNEYKKGSVGKPLIGKIKIAEDGEILYMGKNNFAGYKDNIEATKEVLRDDGWLQTGDVGKIDGDGFLFITGRKKELIITAGGENVAPVSIENAIKKNAPKISQVVVIGDKRKFLSALVTLPHDQKDADKYQEYVKSAVDKYNKNPISSAQKIQKYKLINGDFTVENDLMTPTMKLKRAKIYQKYLGEIESIYE